MFDVEKLIDCVHQNTALWDKGNKLYHDRIAREKCWFAIGQEMYDDYWDGMLISDREAKVKELKIKWRSLRDNFARTLSQGKSGHAAKKKKYVYSDLLEFLNTSIEKSTSGKIENDPDDEDSNDTESERLVESPITPCPPSVLSRKTQNHEKLTNFQTQLLEKLDHSRNDDDCDKFYLLSLLSNYKALNEVQKLQFQRQSAKFFMDVRRGNAHHS